MTDSKKNNLVEQKKKIYVCQYCDKKLSSKRNLQFHEYNMCRFTNKCLKCQQEFLSKKYLERHLKLCCQNFKCSKCGKELSRKQTYLIHIAKCSF